MAKVLDEVSRTFSEFLLLPNLTRRDCIPGNVTLTTSLVKHARNQKPALTLNVPMASAIMQAVSDDRMAIELARNGGISFVYGSQDVDEQAAMVGRVKRFKAGFVVSDSNLRPDATIADVVELTKRNGHTTMAVTDDGSPTGKLAGILTSRDYRLHKIDWQTPVSEVMTPFDQLVWAKDGSTLSEANDLIWNHKLNCVPVVDAQRHLRYLVFRKDYDEHKENPLELIDEEKRLVVGAGINSRDYAERIPPLLEAGVDALCIDSSDGFNEWQRDCVRYVRDTYDQSVRIGAGNVVDAEGFEYLAEAGADFVKVGVGGGSICITREQKGIGRGQASAVLDVVAARDAWLERTGEYIPVCSDGGIFHDYHITLALAMGADFVMMGRYFARFDESPAKRVRVGTQFMKEYWGEGTNRAKNWARYEQGPNGRFAFEEGVDGYVPYAGMLKDNLDQTLAKLKASMCNCGATSIEELHRVARLTCVSQTSLREGGVHDVATKDSEISMSN